MPAPPHHLNSAIGRSIFALSEKLAYPDLPVPKAQKQRLRDITLNDGLHLHALALIPPGSQMEGGLDQHFADNQALYVRREHAVARHPLARVHAQPIIRDPDYVTEYVFKSLSRQRFSLDDVLILPRNRGELSAGSERLSCHFL